jgi:hypothetical protein
MHYISSLILVNLAFVTFSQTAVQHNGKNEIYSEYKDGRYFHTHCVYVVNAPFEYAATILDEIFEGMKTAPTSKLEWAFSGLGDVGAKEDMLLYEKGVSYNPLNYEYLLKLHVIVKNDKDMEIDLIGNLRNESFKTEEKIVSLALTKKIKVLHDGIITMSAIPYTDNSSIIILHSQLKFGWFFNLFFTQKRYKSIMEWRLAGFLNNVKKRIETTARDNKKMQKKRSDNQSIKNTELLLVLNQ